MSSPLPEVIRVEETAEGGIRYVLPPRPHGPSRDMARMLVHAGTFVCLIPVLFSLFFYLSNQFMMGGQMPWFVPLAPLGCVGVFCFPLGGILALRGLYQSEGHSEVVLERGRLTAIDRWRGLSRSRQQPVEELRGFRVSQGGVAGALNLAAAQPGLASWRIEADFQSRKVLVLGDGYPKDWLLSLADELGRRCRQESVVGLTALTQSVPVEEESVSSQPVVERPRQPTNSDAMLEERPDGFTIRFPAVGIKRANSWFILVWILFWNAITLPVAFLALGPALGPPLARGKVPPQDTLLLALFFLPFLTVGIGSLLVVLHRGLRRGTITLTGDGLEVVLRGLLRRKRHYWRVEEFRHVETVMAWNLGPAGSAGRTAELRIVPRDGPSASVLGWRDHMEMEWVATLLRQALKLECPAPYVPAPESDEEKAEPVSLVRPELRRQSEAPLSPVKTAIRAVVSLALFAGFAYLFFSGKVSPRWIFVGAFGVVGSLMLVLGLALTVRTVLLLRRGRRTRATVIGLIESRGESGSTFAPKVRFVDHEENAHEVVSSISTSPPAFQPGETVEILYDPAKPEEFLIDSFGQKWGVPLVLTVLGVVFTGVAVVVGLVAK